MTTPKIIQADRDRAARMADDTGATNEECRRIKNGERDDSYFVETLATHRTEACGELLLALDAALDDSPMNQDEMGGCVWCGGPYGKRSGQYAGVSPKDHAKDCAWLLGRALIAKHRESQSDG